MQKDTQAKTNRKKISAKLRMRVLERDGFRCRYCGQSPEDGAALEIDHAIPVSLGGTNAKQNLVTACARCNAGKGARLLPLPDRPPHRCAGASGEIVKFVLSLAKEGYTAEEIIHCGGLSEEKASELYATLEFLERSGRIQRQIIAL